MFLENSIRLFTGKVFGISCEVKIQKLDKLNRREWGRNPNVHVLLWYIYTFSLFVLSFFLNFVSSGHSHYVTILCSFCIMLKVFLLGRF